MINGSLKLLSGTSHKDLSQKIAEIIGTSLVDVTIQSSLESETTVQIQDNVRGSDLFIIQSTHAPTNHYWMELMILIDAAKRASANRITAVIPFYGYARQDRKDKPRVPITAKLMANLLVAAGVDRVLTMDLHTPQIVGFFDIPTDHIHTVRTFCNYIKRYRQDNMTIVAPDTGSVRIAELYANLLGCPLAFITKKRKDSQTVEATSIVGDIKGRDVLIIDDISQSGSTLLEAAKLLKSKEPTSIRAIVSHGIFNQQAKERLKNNIFDEIITTDSTPVEKSVGMPLTILSVADVLAETIQRIHRNETLIDLLV